MTRDYLRSCANLLLFGGDQHATIRTDLPRRCFYLFRVVNERHIPATSEETRNAEAAAKDPALSLSQNHGHPTVAATPHPAEFKGPGIIAAHPGKPIEARRPLKTPTGGSTTPSPSNKSSNEPSTLKSNAPVTNGQKPPSRPKPLEERSSVNPPPPAASVKPAKPVAAPHRRRLRRRVGPPTATGQAQMSSGPETLTTFGARDHRSRRYKFGRLQSPRRQTGEAIEAKSTPNNASAFCYGADDALSALAVS